MPGIEQWLNAEAVPRREDVAARLIPEDEGELAAQVMQTLGTEVLVKVKGNLAVGARAKAVAACFQLALDSLKSVEFAIHDDPRPLILAGNGLVAGRNVDDTQPRVAQAHFPVG
jgi:hypothetical protein